TCTGVAGQACPSDAKKANGAACTDDGNLCTTDTCNGTSVSCQHTVGSPLGVCLTQTKSAAGTCVNATGIGTLAWSNASRAQTSDNSYATAAFSANGDASNFLKCTDFGFTIPSGSMIEGIQVEWEYANPGPQSEVKDKAARVVKGGTIGTPDRATTVAWPSTDSFVTYGDAADMWSDSWAAAD